VKNDKFFTREFVLRHWKPRRWS